MAAATLDPTGVAIGIDVTSSVPVAVTAAAGTVAAMAVVTDAGTDRAMVAAKVVAKVVGTHDAMSARRATMCVVTDNPRS